jgi:peroxiredoxin
MSMGWVRGGGIVLAAVLGVGSAMAQQGAHAALVPVASRVAAPAFQLPDAGGASKQLSDYRGKVAVLNFWATACGGCKMEIPWLIALQTAHKSDSFTVVGVSMDTSYEGTKTAEEAWGQVKPFVEAQKMNYPVLLGDGMLITTYKLGAVPATSLIDKQGRVAATYNGVADKSDVDANVTKLLAE